MAAATRLLRQPLLFSDIYRRPPSQPRRLRRQHPGLRSGERCDRGSDPPVTPSKARLATEGQTQCRAQLNETPVLHRGERSDAQPPVRRSASSRPPQASSRTGVRIVVPKVISSQTLLSRSPLKRGSYEETDLPKSSRPSSPSFMAHRPVNSLVTLAGYRRSVEFSA